METVVTALPEALSEVARGINEKAAEKRWSISARIAFRFICSYFVLYSFPAPLGFVEFYLAQWGSWVPWLYERLLGWSDAMWTAPTLWMAAHVFHVTASSVENGSGDRTFDWVQLALFLVLAAALTLIWSALDRKNRYDERIYPWFRLYMRIVLAMIILYYGAAKIFPSQFYAIPLSRYMQPLAAGSPMGLLWSMMSASRTYTFFAGFVETLAAVLLFVPRFATLGGLVAVAAMTNVFMLNVGYDVPVKLEAFNLLVAGILVAGADLPNIAALFLFNRPLRLYTPAPLFRRPWLNRAGLAAQLACCALFVPAALLTLQGSAAKRAASPPYYGLWKVQSFRLQGTLRPPLTTDSVRWRQVAFDHFDRFWIQPMDGLPGAYYMTIGAKQTTLSLKSIGWESGASEASPSGPTLGTFAIRVRTADHLVLDGKFRGKRIEATLSRVPLSSFLLVNRSFHWINETPFNR